VFKKYHKFDDIDDQSEQNRQSWFDVYKLSCIMMHYQLISTIFMSYCYM
jgi:hypothetical protein